MPTPGRGLYLSPRIGYKPECVFQEASHTLVGLPFSFAFGGDKHSLLLDSQVPKRERKSSWPSFCLPLPV